MNLKHCPSLQLFVGFCTCWIGLSDAVAQDTKKTDIGKLHFVDSVRRDDLLMVTSTELSSDGNFLYASAWQAATVNVFKRDPVSGKLKHVQSITDFDNLKGATSVRLSPNGRYAVAVAFRSRTAVLYKRDPIDGKLSLADVSRDGENGVQGLRWPVDAAFSPDSRFVYVIDSRGSGASDPGLRMTGSVTAFRISEDDKLQFIEANIGKDACFGNVRGIVVHPNGKVILVTCSDAATLVVLDRDEKTGKTKVRQIIKDEEGKVRGLEGAMGIALSPDGKFVYTSSGRFHGDNSVGVFRFNKDGELSLVEEIVNDEGALRNFVGGNEIAVSPDGRNVYAVASRSGSLACFERDSKTGKLEYLETILDEEGRVGAAAGIGISPDGNFVYVAAETSNTISVFRRDTKRGKF